MRSKLRNYSKCSRSHRPVAGHMFEALLRGRRTAPWLQHSGPPFVPKLIEVYPGGGPAGEGEAFSPFFFPPSGFP
jgi:hypothetical protein